MFMLAKNLPFDSDILIWKNSISLKNTWTLFADTVCTRGMPAKENPCGSRKTMEVFFHSSEVIWAVHQAKVIHQNAKQPSLNIQYSGNSIPLHTVQRTHISRLRQQIRIGALMSLCTSHTRQLGQINIGIQFISQINQHRACLELYHTWALLLHST